MYGHILPLARKMKDGVESKGLQADIFLLPETLDDFVLSKMAAPEKPSEIPTASNATLKEYDAFLFGIPTRFGNVPAQFSTFFDATGSLWMEGALYGKCAGLFVSTGTPGAQEMTARNFLSTLAHHGMIYVPLGCASAFAQLTNLSEPRGGSAWGAGTYAGATGERAASELELDVARIQGEEFAKVLIPKPKKSGSNAEAEKVDVAQTVEDHKAAEALKETTDEQKPSSAGQKESTLEESSQKEEDPEESALNEKPGLEEKTKVQPKSEKRTTNPADKEKDKSSGGMCGCKCIIM